jgi:hypothetical protein
MRTILVSSVLVLGVAASGPAAARTPGGHCPPSATVWDVGDTSVYAADNLTDEMGNGNGIVCALAKKLVLDENGEWFQMYQFIDDTGTTR